MPDDDESAAREEDVSCELFPREALEDADAAEEDTGALAELPAKDALIPDDTVPLVAEDVPCEDAVVEVAALTLPELLLPTVPPLVDDDDDDPPVSLGTQPITNSQQPNAPRPAFPMFSVIPCHPGKWPEPSSGVTGGALK